MDYPDTVGELTEILRQRGYLADRGLATALFVALSLRRPILLEGEVGVGKTEVAKVLSEAFGRTLIQLGGSFMDYLLPTSLECPSWELGATVTPCPHHPIGAKGVGESATVGSPAAVINAVIDALRPFGVRHADMPLTPANVWSAIQGRPVRTDLASR